MALLTRTTPWLDSPLSTVAAGLALTALAGLPLAGAVPAAALSTVALGLALSAWLLSARSPTLGEYVLEAKIGEGGMATVYRGRHRRLGHRAAVKVMAGGTDREKGKRRFLREAALASRATNPHSVAVLGQEALPDGTVYLAMEYLDGQDLEALVEREGPLDEERVVGIVAQLCVALERAHEAGVIHGDVKPGNVVVTRGPGGESAKLVDFGLARDLTDPSCSLSGRHGLRGTPLYMAPEAILEPESTGVRADLYALGAVAYFLLTGGPVFRARTSLEACIHHLESRPEAPSERLGRPVSPALEGLILALLEKRPEDRPRSASEVRERLGAAG